MSKYLKPCRGSYNSAVEQSLILKKGELFFEFPHGSTGKEPAKIMIGDGVSGYGTSGVNPNDTSGASTNSFAPALIHPVLYSPEFTDSNYATASWNINSGTAAISNIKPYSKDSHMGNLPKIIGNIKQALCNHADSIMKLHEMIEDVASSTIDLKTIYPVGSLYLTTSDSASANPNNFINGTTWKKLPANYALKTVSSSGGSTAAAGNTGGTALDITQIPSHNHTYSKAMVQNSVDTDGGGTTVQAWTDDMEDSVHTGFTGGDNTAQHKTVAHAHTAGMPANIGVVVWKRTN
jgi:hypothetical protein